MLWGAKGEIVRSIILGVSLVLFTAVSSFGQTANTGSITGTVKDQSGSVIPDVRVTIRESSTGAERTVTTDAVGGYRALLLEPGVYTVHLVRDGFGAVDLHDVRVLITETTVADHLYVTYDLGAWSKPRRVAINGASPTNVAQLDTKAA